MPGDLAVTLVDIAGACRDGLMAVAVDAGLGMALAIMADEAAQTSWPLAQPALHTRIYRPDAHDPEAIAEPKQ